jgi:hypothetical protein
MQRFKQTWFTFGRVGRWTLGFCRDVRCLRAALRRQRLARRGGEVAPGVFAVQSRAYMLVRR